VRLRTDAPLSPGALWATPLSGARIEWLPAGEDAGDIWVLYRPENLWPLDSVLRVSAGGVVLNGLPLASGAVAFQVESHAGHARRIQSPPLSLWQPEPGRDYAPAAPEYGE